MLCRYVWVGAGNKFVQYAQLNPLYRIIGHILPQVNLFPIGGRHFILWPAWVCLLLIQNSSQCSNSKCRGTSHHYCNFQSSNCTEGSQFDIIMHLITVMPHPTRLVVGRGYERDLTSAACPLGGAFALHGELLLYIGTFV